MRTTRRNRRFALASLPLLPCCFLAAPPPLAAREAGSPAADEGETDYQATGKVLRADHPGSSTAE